MLRHVVGMILGAASLGFTSLGAASLGFTSRGDAECIQMRNHGNVQYTISSFEIGGQQLDVIPDTGCCRSCGGSR